MKKFLLSFMVFLLLVNCANSFEDEDGNEQLLTQAVIVSLAQGIARNNATFSIGGSVSGLSSDGLVLQNNESDDLAVNSGATEFTFPTKVNNEAGYNVTVKTQPTGQTCEVANGSGTATANVTNIAITCNETSFRNALSFDGTDDHVTIGEMSELQNASAYTIEMWLNFESGVTVLGTKEASDTPKIDIESAGTNDLRFFQNNNQAGWKASSGGSFPFNQWVHVAVVFDGSQAGFDKLKLYKNGTEVTTISTSGTIDATTSATLGPVTLGAQPGTNPPTTSDFEFRGRMDDLRIWNVARTQAQIQSNYNSPLKNPSSETSLVAYYKFNATSGTTLVDEKGKYNGTLQNMTDSNWVESGAGSN